VIHAARSETAIGMVVLLAALCLIVGVTVAAVTFVCAALVIAYIRYCR
jgi:hypothetical protein